jgi:hypothetical protein
MANETIVNYLKKHRGSYSSRALRKRILSNGYSKNDYKEAIKSLSSKEDSGAPALHANAPTSTGFKWIRFSAIIGAVFLVLNLINLILDFFNLGFSKLYVSYISTSYIPLSIALFVLVFTVLYGLYLYGFFKIGGKVGSRLLKTSSATYIVIIALFSISLVIYNIFIYDAIKYETSFSLLNPGILIPLLFVGLMFLIRGIFSYGIMRVRSSVRFSFVASIFGIIFTIISFVLYGYYIYFLTSPLEFLIFFLSIDPTILSVISWGVYIVGFAVILFETLTLFNASKKFEN